MVKYARACSQLMHLSLSGELEYKFLDKKSKKSNNIKRNKKKRRDNLIKNRKSKMLKLALM